MRANQYVLKIDQPLKKAIENGDVKFEKNVKGEIVAQLRRKNGQFSGIIPIEKELKEEGISSANLEMAMQMEAIKQQLQSIIESLKERLLKCFKAKEMIVLVCFIAV